MKSDRYRLERIAEIGNQLLEIVDRKGITAEECLFAHSGAGGKGDALQLTAVGKRKFTYRGYRHGVKGCQRGTSEKCVFPYADRCGACEMHSFKG